MTHPRAGEPARADDLVDLDALLRAYAEDGPDPTAPAEQVSFGTSGHRGSSLTRSFNEPHVLAMTQAVAEFRDRNGISGPLFVGRDTHALSEPAFHTTVAVLVANGVDVRVDAGDGFTPTPAISHAILTENRGDGPRADGLVITPSHNPPEDGGYKYNPPTGGPADTDVTSWIEARANELLRGGLAGVRRADIDGAREAARPVDYVDRYVSDLPAVVDVAGIRDAGVRMGADPLGGASVAYWGAVADVHDLDLTVVDDRVDPAFGGMTLDWDGRIRMDCSSPYAMARLIDARDRFDVSFGNDADADRHGIVTPAGGLLPPNAYLALVIDHLLTTRDGWPGDAAIGKTLVSSQIIDRVVAAAGRRLVEVPVGFKWFVDGLRDGSLAFGGEESAGASFLRRDGRVWTTDKDGIVLCLLAAEIIARTGEDPADRYAALGQRFGTPAYRRVDAPASSEQKAALKALTPEQVRRDHLAGDPIDAVLTRAPGNDAAIGGLKVVTEHGWFAARPSGTEDIYKIYAESFRGEAHLERILQEAQGVVQDALAGT
ncbi:MAG: phosphoglucomutase (alpha-D-glucose-1,6-bisphosphate-dependent) [Actinobacteria bacterium]|nr:phosphoglucomutase (alpha-D-glucose-1,6-bisphosphate-dependent) [Actinomycetota bacterium]